MHVSKLFVVSIMLLVLSSQFLVAASFAGASEDTAASALANAEESIVLAYQATLNAEEAGANVSGLLVRLNEAGQLLASAQIEYRLDDFEKANELSESSKSIAEEVQNAAVNLKDSALSESAQRMLSTMVASVLGVASIALVSLYAWYLLKKRCGSTGF